MSKPTAADAGRACMNCGANKTPVWRTGPSGPKTMCNRCGIKWMRSREDLLGEIPAMDAAASHSEGAQSPVLKRKRERVGSFDLSISKAEVSTDQSSSPEVTPREGNPGKLSPRGVKRGYIKKKYYDEEDDEELESLDRSEIKLKSPKIKKLRIERVSSNCRLPFGSSDSLNFNPNMALHADDAHLLGIDDDSNTHELHSACPSPTEQYSITTYTTQINAGANMSDPSPAYIKITAPETKNFSLSACCSSKESLNKLLGISAENSNVFTGSSESFPQVNSIGNILPVTTQYLDLSFHLNVNVNTLRALPPSLYYLNLSRCKQLVDNDLLYLPPQLHTLHISHCANLTDESIKHLPNSLQVLNISNCYNITDEGIKCLPMTLVSLNVSMCWKITDEGLESLPSLLTKLNLESCKITNEGLRNLPSSMRELNLQSCENITNDCLNYISSDLDHLNIGYTKISSCKALKNKNLRHLDLTQCEITDDDINELPQSLEWLNLFRCSKITSRSLALLPSSIGFVNFRSTMVEESKVEDLKALMPNLKLFI